VRGGGENVRAACKLTTNRFVVWGETYAEVLEEVLGLGVDVELAALGVLGEVQSRDLGDVLVLALTLLLLELEGDTTDGSTLDALHQVGGVAGNLFGRVRDTASTNRLDSPLCCSKTHLVAEALGGDDGDLIADALVGLEVEGQLGVVPLNDDLGGLLDSLGANATHLDGLVGTGGGRIPVVSWRVSWTGKFEMGCRGLGFFVNLNLDRSIRALWGRARQWTHIKSRWGSLPWRWLVLRGSVWLGSVVSKQASCMSSLWST